MPSVSRTNRLAGELKKAIAASLPEIKDPRLSEMTAITRVELTRDLKYAKVYVSVFDDPGRREETIAALNHAEGYVKHLVSGTMEIRSMPRLTFILDDSAEYSAHISKLIDEALK